MFLFIGYYRIGIVVIFNNKWYFVVMIIRVLKLEMLFIVG